MIRVQNKFPLFDGRPKIALVGEAPGEDEERYGVPFVGMSGQLLDKVLSEVKLSKAAMFIGNVYQYRPPDNNIASVDKTGTAWNESLEQLRTDLLKFQPEIIVALGETAMQQLTNKYGITKWRGSVLPCSFLGADFKAKVIPAFHPAFVLRTWGWRSILAYDIEKAKEEAENPQELPRRMFLINPSFHEVIEHIKEFHHEQEISLDFETTMGDAVPLCLAISARPGYAICIPLDERWTWEEEIAIYKALEDLMMDPAVGKIFQNCQFDLSVMYTHLGIYVKNVVMDTMLAHHACYPEWPKSLAFQTSIYTREPYYKEDHKDSEEKEWNPAACDRDKLYEYNCKDACVTLEIAQKLKVELAKIGALAGFERDMRAIKPAMEMTLTGIRVDAERSLQEFNSLQEAVDANQTIIKGVFGREVNVKSPKDMKQLLYVELGLPAKYKSYKGRRSASVTTDADALIELARQFPKANLEVLLKTRQLRTAQGFFELDTYKDGRIHASFNVAGTETGRWSSSASMFGGRGIMNIPDGTRPPFINCRTIYQADPGCVFVAFDQAQAEARYVAYEGYALTGDSSYKKIIESGEKIHVWFGKRLCERRICPMSIEEFVARTTERAKTWYLISKTSIHGFSYDLGPLKWTRRLAKDTDGAVIVSVAQAKLIKEFLYETIPTIPKRQQAIQTYLRNNYKMINAFGRTRIFFERYGDDLFGEAYANNPQSSIADNTSESIWAIYCQVPRLAILQQNYDSMLGQCKLGEEMEVIEQVRPLVVRPITVTDFHGRNPQTFTIPVEFKVGLNWGEMEEVK